MSKSRVPLALGLAGAGGIGYYLFNAGGNPKAAEKKFEGQSTLTRHPLHQLKMAVLHQL